MVTLSEDKNVFKECNFIKKTERRLKYYNYLCAKLEMDRKSVEKLRKISLTSNLHCDKIVEIESSILTCELEVESINSALEQIKDDYYFQIIPLKYFKHKSECAISFVLNCDISTVYRNKNRLLKILSSYFYAGGFV